MPKSPDIEAAVDRGLAFLEKRQEADGSFVSFSSASMLPFRCLRSWRTTFVPALMLASLACLEQPGAGRVRRKLAEFLLEQKNADWAFNYWAKSAPEYRTMPYPNDLDDTFCTLAALHLYDPSMIDETVLAKSIRLLLAAETKVGGPYRTWLVPPGSEPVWLDVDVAVNSNIAYFLSLVSNRLPSLDKLIGQAITSDTFSSPYYPSAYAFIYYFARAYDGPHRDRLLRRTRQLHKTAPTDLDRALCLGARVRLHDNQSLVAPVKKLLAGQRRDGSWPAAAFYADPEKNGKAYHNGAAALTTAFALEALGLYAASRTPSTARSKAASGSGRSREAKTGVLSLARKQCRALPPDLRRTTLRSLTKLAESGNGAEITGLPKMFNHSLDKPYGASEAFLDNLGLANLCGWLAYTIYDDFLDEEGDPASLPSANTAMRGSLNGFLLALPDDRRFQEQVHEIFNMIDGANAWELSHCRFRRRDGMLFIGALPDYGGLSKLAERSLGHTLAPLAILYARKSGAETVRHTKEALAQYLIVRQLNDDLHDWQEDLGNGHITYVVGQVLKGLNLKRGGHDIAALTRKAGKQFWYETLPAVCRDMERRVGKGRRALVNAGIFKESGGMGALFDRQEASIRETLAQQSQAETFLKQYRGKAVQL
jgi:hypothetical protein